VKGKRVFNNKKVLAFVPGKTGSVGLPGKLFKEIGGRSLLEWTLLAAWQSDYIDEIVVSSNDPLIKSAVEKFGNPLYKKSNISFIQRPNELCTSTSKTEEAISNLFLMHPYYRDFDYLIMLQATSPARRNGLIDNCFRNMNNYDSLITVEKSTPFFWKVNTEVAVNYPDYSLANRPMRQELKESDFYYKDNGNIYITKVFNFLQSKLRVSGKTFLYETSKFENLQIDDIEDFIMMESLYKHYGSFL